MITDLFGVGGDTDGGRGGGGATRQSLVELLRQERHERRDEEESCLQTCVAIIGGESGTEAVTRNGFYTKCNVLMVSTTQ